MKALTLLPTVLALLSQAALADAVLETVPNTLTEASQKVFDGSFEKVVCVETPTLRVRDADLKTVLFLVPNFSPVKVFQGWGENKRTKKIEGETVTFIKVQFPGSGDQIGWIADYLIRPRSRCEGTRNEPIPTPAPAPTPSPAPAPGPINDTNVRGLNDPACCAFPLKAEPTANYETEQRRFGANRDGGGRLHAACDLYRHKNDPIVSVAPGTVLRNPYYFYQDTYALEVRHEGGFVVRYGEITAKRAAGVGAGSQVKMGQVVGYMGKVSSNCCVPMLHFELYSGAKNGSLKSGGNKYGRRADILNPAKYLRRWEENSWRHRR